MPELKRSDLHSYQQYAVDFIETHAESMLILQMGLGKTIIALTAIADLMFDSFDIDSGSVLIIGPLRVCQSVWPVEVKNWQHTSLLSMSVICGSAKQRKEALNRKADVYVVNRENLKWLTDLYEKSHRKWNFRFVIIDELSSFKNWKSERFRALRKVRPYISRIAGLTGSPGNLMDLWAEVGILDQGKRLGKFIGRYRSAYFRPASMNPHNGIVFSYAPLPGAEEQIMKRISDMAISMKSKDFLDMPPLVEVDHYVEMTPDEKKIYKQMVKDLTVDIKDQEITAANAAVLSGKLLQIASGAVKTEDDGWIEIHHHKLDLLADLIEEANQNVLVVYWFRHNHERIKGFLEAKEYKVRDIRTPEDIDAWNSGSVPVALINPASAGHGLNLQRGSSIEIWVDIGGGWSLEMYEQTVCRLYRQGQTHPVSIHRILCKDTIDERVISMLKDKDDSQNRLIDAVKAELGKK